MRITGSGETRNAHGILVEKLLGERVLERPRKNSEDNIKINLTEM